MIDEIQNYSLYTERITLSTLIALAFEKSVINEGTQGIGKSRCTVELLKALNVPFEIGSTHFTERSLFDFLRKNNNKLIIIDESASILYNKEILNMLLCALVKERISWETTRELLSFRFVGTIIFNCNQLPKNPIVEAVKDRCIFNEIRLDGSQIKEKIKQSYSYKLDKDRWNFIKGKVEQEVESEEEIKKQVTRLLKYVELKSVRDKGKMELICRLSKRLLGDFSLISYFFNVDNERLIMESELSRAEKVKRIANNRKCSIRTAQRIVKSFS